MAHIPPSAAIFSPSVARLASSEAKDWSYVDSWLSSKFTGRSPPPFERNNETLRVLVALATINEGIDEEHGLVANAEVAGLQGLYSIDPNMEHNLDASVRSSTTVAQSIMSAIEASLSRVGQSAFESLAAASIEVGIAFPAPEIIARKVTDLQKHIFQLGQALFRIQKLLVRVNAQSRNVQSRIQEQEQDSRRPSTSLARLNLELQRKIRAETARLRDTKEKISISFRPPAPSVQQLKDDEATFVELWEYNESLNKQIECFKDLPPNTELAKQQLDALRDELHAATQKRDIVFEGLVERATPKRSK